MGEGIANSEVAEGNMEVEWFTINSAAKNVNTSAMRDVDLGRMVDESCARIYSSIAKADDEDSKVFVVGWPELHQLGILSRKSPSFLQFISH